MEFTSPLAQKPGIIADILKQSYAGLVASDPDLWSQEETKWEAYDREVFEYQESVGACIFLTWENNELIGFGSYDPRQRPEIGRIGHNCILPEFRGNGFGRKQLREIIRRLRSINIKAAKAFTCSHPFFIPAQLMYVECGFVEAGRRPLEIDCRFEIIEYVKMMDNTKLERP